MATSTNSPVAAAAVTVPAPRGGRLISAVSARFAGAAAIVAGGLSLVTGVLQIVFPQDETPEIDPRTRIILLMFTVSLWALAVLFLGLARYARSSWGAFVAAAGTVLLTTGTVTSAVNGVDLAFFPIVAMAANALWLVGAIGLTATLARARRVSLWLVLPLPFIQLTLVFFSQMGGGVLSGAFLIILGAVLVTGRIQSRVAARLRKG
ncbi:hypothetical protein QSU92_04920 [Microbacterium sp. ET2]|uniref:hypothetical protein n=1 Tax=Microbacterium albipurpureum TaxID=3050384 RepID=UPI00259CF00B|nr:hypothetical protein [Microbacterium sp. ET2 (Ac-2212)]WJL96527.1 hypothetical protein QSU92_04920 [Microbacterium sp. ET2 (Ac-2212)]